MLARINWTFFFKEEIFESSMESLMTSMAETMVNQRPQVDSAITDSEDIMFHGMNVNINLNKSVKNDFIEEEIDNEDNEQSQTIKPLQNCQSGIKYGLWDRNFDNKSEVLWVDFKKKFESDYHDKIVKQYSEDRYKFFVNLIYKDIFDLQKIVRKSQYDAFCEGNPNADMHRFYNRLQDYATGYHAMVEVFSMSSSLRLTTIQNLGKYIHYWYLIRSHQGPFLAIEV